MSKKTKNKRKKINISISNRIMIISLCLSTLGMLSLGFGLSYSFLTFEQRGVNANTISAGTLQLTMTNEGNAITMENAVPQTDNNALRYNPEYTFKLNNTGSLTATYEVALNNICSTSTAYTVGGNSITPDICIPLEYINVGVKIGTGEYQVVEFANNKIVLDSGTIDASQSINYTIKVWLKEETPNTYNQDTQSILAILKANISGSQLINGQLPSINSGCFTYNGTPTAITITDYRCYAGNPYGLSTITNVVIPTQIDGRNVTGIGDSAFQSNQLTGAITIPDNVTTIGTNAFANNQITSVKMGSAYGASKANSIGANAFMKTSSSNPGLASITNNSGSSFDWPLIVNGTTGSNFIIGTVFNSNGNVTINRSTIPSALE